jgi:hypothetical protein
MNESKHIKKYMCKRLRMLEYLKEHGFTPCATIPDPTNVRYNWWLFESTPELDKCVAAYFEQLQQRKN